MPMHYVQLCAVYLPPILQLNPKKATMLTSRYRLKGKRQHLLGPNQDNIRVAMARLPLQPPSKASHAPEA